MFYAEKFRVLRKNKKIQLNAIATELNKHRKTIWAWETGKASPSLMEMKELASLIGVPLSDISDEASISEEQDAPIDTEMMKHDLEGLKPKDKKYVQKLQRLLLSTTRENKSFRTEIERHSTIFNAVQSSIYTKDKNFLFTFLNSAYLNFLKRDKASTLGKTNHSLFSLKESEVLDGLEKQVMAGEHVHNIEISMPGEHGLKGLFSGEPIVDEMTGRIKGITVLIEDVTARKNAFDRYKILESGINLSQDVFWIKTLFPEMKFKYISASLSNILGYKSEDFFNNPTFWINNVVYSEDVEKMVEYYDYNTKHLRNSSMDYRILTKSGEVKHVVEYHYILKEYGLMFGIIRDVTEQRDAEQNSALLERIVDEKVPEAVWICEKDSTKLRYISEAVKPLTGFLVKMFSSNDQLFIDMIHPKDRKRVVKWLNYDKDKHSTARKYRIITNDGTVKWIENRKYSNYRVDGKNIVFGTLRAIEEKDDMQQEG